MSDISAISNVQILPPLKNNLVQERKAPSRLVSGAPDQLQTLQAQSGAVIPGINIAQSEGVALYKAVNTALDASTGDSSVEHQPVRLGSIIDIEV